MSGFLQNDDNKGQTGRLLLAFALSIGLLMVWQVLFPPAAPPPASSEGSGQDAAAAGTGVATVGSGAVPTTLSAAPEGSGAPPPVAEAPTQVLQTTNTVVSLSNQGGGMVGATILAPTQYIPHDDVAGVFPDGSQQNASLQLRIGGLPDLTTSAMWEVVEAESGAPTNSADGVVRDRVTLRWTSPDGAIEVRRVYRAAEHTFGTRLDVTVTNRGTAERRFDGIDLGVVGTYDPEVKRSMFGARTSVLEALCDGDFGTERRFAAKISETRSYDGAPQFVGVNEQYFMSALMPLNVSQGRACRFRRITDTSVMAELVGAEFSVAPGATQTFEYTVFTGPKDVSFLEPFDRNLNAAIDLGWFSILAILIREILIFFHGLVHNWGLAIILLTIVVKLLLYPVTQKAFVGMEKMRAIQPRLQELQKKYENDRMKLGEEQMKLFKETGTSPFGGCLPLLMQMPIYIALYRTIQGSTELYNAPFYGWIHDLSHQDPWLILPLAMGITMWIQNKLSPQPVDNPQMMAVQRIMPFMFTAFMLFLPSGLVLYIFVNMLLSIAQQLHIRRSMQKAREARP